MLQEYAGTVHQLNNKILWPIIIFFFNSINFKYIAYSYQNNPPRMKVLGYQLNTVFGTVVKTLDSWISNTKTL